MRYVYSTGMPKRHRFPTHINDLVDDRADARYSEACVVLLETGRKVYRGEAIDLTMGQANVIWRGDAIERILRSFSHCTAPSSPLNIGLPTKYERRDGEF